MSQKSNLAIGAGVGAATGVVAGLKKAKSTIPAGFKDEAGKLLTKDAYIKARQVANEEAIISNVRTSKIQETFAKVAKKAAVDWDGVAKKVKNTKLKWVAALGLAGAAVGTGIALIVNKLKASKTEKASIGFHQG